MLLLGSMLLRITSTMPLHKALLHSCFFEASEVCKPLNSDTSFTAESPGQRVDFVLERLTELRAVWLIEPRRIDGIERDRAGVGHAEVGPEKKRRYASPMSVSNIAGSSVASVIASPAACMCLIASRRMASRSRVEGLGQQVNAMPSSRACAHMSRR